MSAPIAIVPLDDTCADTLAGAFHDGLVHVELAVRADNAPAITPYRAVGFRDEALEARGPRHDGDFVDSIAMALLLDEPPIPR